MTYPIWARAQCAFSALPFILAVFLADGACAQESPPSQNSVSFDVNVVATQLDIARSEIQPTDTTTLTAGYSRYFVPPPFGLIAAPTISLFVNTTAAPARTLVH